MPPPTLYIKNALKLALDGLGDGTVYASATSAVVNQQNKTFTLSGLSLIADIGADADDKFNSHHLYFPPSGNKYLIVDWVAATNAATTLETPALTDIGACEIRRILIDPNTLASNPAIALADGSLANIWKSVEDLSLTIHLPNLVENGGFESGVDLPWTKKQLGGTTDTSGITTVGVSLGSYGYFLSAGDRTSVALIQSLKLDIMKGKTYRILLKARFSSTYEPDRFRIGISTSSPWNNLVFSNPSSGSVDATHWRPVLTPSTTWHYVDFTPADANIAQGINSIYFEIASNLFDINIDEISIFEIVNVGSLLVFGANNGTGSVSVSALNCPDDRDGFLSGDDGVGLLPTTQVLGDNSVIAQDLALAGVAPIYKIEVSSGFFAAAEILLCEKWVWGRHVKGRFDPREVAQRRIDTDTKSGVHNSVKFSENRVLKGKVVNISDVDLKKWNDDFYPLHHQQKHPFAVKIDDTAPLLLMRDKSNSFGNPYDGPRVSMDFDWIEII